MHSEPRVWFPGRRATASAVASVGGPHPLCERAPRTASGYTGANPEREPSICLPDPVILSEVTVGFRGKQRRRVPEVPLHVGSEPPAMGQSEACAWRQVVHPHPGDADSVQDGAQFRAGGERLAVSGCGNTRGLPQGSRSGAQRGWRSSRPRWAPSAPSRSPGARCSSDGRSPAAG
jgi:hypothetical protein